MRFLSHRWKRSHGSKRNIETHDTNVFSIFSIDVTTPKQNSVAERLMYHQNGEIYIEICVTTFVNYLGDK